MKLSGKCVKGLGNSRKLDYPTVNFTYSQPFQLGLYKGNTKDGECLLFITRKNFGEYHTINKVIDVNPSDPIEITDIRPFDIPECIGVVDTLRCGFAYKKIMVYTKYAFCLLIAILMMIAVLYVRRYVSA